MPAPSGRVPASVTALSSPPSSLTFAPATSPDSASGNRTPANRSRNGPVCPDSATGCPFKLPCSSTASASAAAERVSSQAVQLVVCRGCPGFSVAQGHGKLLDLQLLYRHAPHANACARVRLLAELPVGLTAGIGFQQQIGIDQPDPRDVNLSHQQRNKPDAHPKLPNMRHLRLRAPGCVGQRYVVYS